MSPPVLALSLLAVSLNCAGAWSVPSLLLGECSTAWTSSWAKYRMPYRVQFGADGRYRWWAPYRVGPATEVGKGMILSQPARTEHADGSWEAHWFASNNFLPSPDNSTNCCCEYVGGKGPGHPRVLADYCVASVPNSLDKPQEETCAPFIRTCPASNATALQEMGKPFIEVYTECSAGILVEPWAEALAAAASLLTLLMGIASLMRLAVRAHKTALEDAPDGYRPLAAEEGRAPATCTAQSEEELPPDVGKPKRQEAESLGFDVGAQRQDTSDSLATTAVPDFPWSRSSTTLAPA
jgi:hypothetical protein